MKTFSVRFFKRLILLILVLMILVPTVCAISLGMKCSRLEAQLEGGEGPVSSEAPAHPSLDPLELKGEAMAYQQLYPELYSTARLPDQRYRKENTVYLTFHTSLNENTKQILNVLDQYGIKATFFVTGTGDPDALAILKSIADRGHTIGLYSYSDSYTTIYKSVEAYLDDFKQIYDLVYDTTGIKAEIFRFPGGSINSYNSGMYRELIAEMLRRNFLFFDWNVSGGGGTTSDEVANNILTGMGSASRGFIALEDRAGREAEVEALPAVIQGLKDRGYDFQPLTAIVEPVIFSYKGAE